MPIDPRIILSGQMPPPIQPLESVGRVLALQNMMRQGQDADLRRKVTLQQLADADRTRQVIAGAGGDPTKMISGLMGVNPALAMDLQNKGAEGAVHQGTVTLNDMKIASEKVGRIGGYAQSVLSVPPEQRPAVWTALRARAIQEGVIKPEHAPEAYPGDAQLTAWGQSTMTAKDQIDAKIKEQTAAAEKGFREGTISGQEAGRKETARHNKALEGRASVQDAADRRALEKRKFDAEQEKGKELRVLEQRFLTGAINPVNGAVEKMTSKQLADAKLGIERTYRAKIGDVQPETLPPSWSVAAPGTRPGSPQVAAPAPAAPVAVAARPAAPTVPAEVSAVLKGQKAGTYTLTDGSKWIVGADGSVSPGR
jgi:hypothetical protein